MDLHDRTFGEIKEAELTWPHEVSAPPTPSSASSSSAPTSQGQQDYLVAVSSN